MGATIGGRGAWLLAAAVGLVVAPAARAQSDEADGAADTETDQAMPPSPRAVPPSPPAQPPPAPRTALTPAFPTGAEQDTDYPAVQESDLELAPRTTQTPPNWNGDLDQPVFSIPDAIERHVQEHRDFVQPFLDPAVFPEISARIMNTGGYGPRDRAGDFGQFAYVSAYYIDVYAPLLTIRDNSPFSTDRFRMNLKLPITLGQQVFTLFLGGNLPTNTSWTTGGGINGMVGYAFGSRGFSIQARAGFGYDQLIGDTESPLAESFLADVAAGINVCAHAQLLLQADGRKLIGSPGGTFRAWPGLRFLPLEDPTLSLGIGAMWWLDSYSPAGQYVGTFGTKQVGAFADVGYVFF